MKPLDASRGPPDKGAPSYALHHRALRAFWYVSWCLLASWTPAPLHRWRVWLLRLFGAQIDTTAHVYGSARIWYPALLSMGAHACLGPRVDCYCMASIKIGPRAVVSQGAFLCAGTHDIEDADFQLVAKPIVIGEDAWIAAEAFIGPGVTVGASAVIGARAVLFKDAQAGGVYVGNPAKLTKHRLKKIDQDDQAN